MHACNPPDLLFLIALVLRPGGARFVFDHHDLVPELFVSRLSSVGRTLYWLTRFVGAPHLRLADAVISTNESYRRVAIERGKMAADRVGVVRSAPDLSRFVPLAPESSLASRQAIPARVPGRDGTDRTASTTLCGRCNCCVMSSGETIFTAYSWVQAMHSTRWWR